MSLLQINPSTLTYEPGVPGNLKKYSLTLTNNTNKIIIYKARTTAQEIYAVKPNINIIQPHKEAQVTIKRIEPLNSSSSVRQKLLFLTTVVPINLAHLPVTELWKIIENNKQDYVVHNQLVLCEKKGSMDTTSSVRTVKIDTTVSEIKAAIPTPYESTDIIKELDDIYDTIERLEYQIRLLSQPNESQSNYDVTKNQKQYEGVPSKIFFLVAIMVFLIAYKYF